MTVASAFVAFFAYALIPLQNTPPPRRTRRWAGPDGWFRPSWDSLHRPSWFRTRWPAACGRYPTRLMHAIPPSYVLSGDTLTNHSGILVHPHTGSAASTSKRKSNARNLRHTGKHCDSRKENGNRSDFHGFHIPLQWRMNNNPLPFSPNLAEEAEAVSGKALAIGRLYITRRRTEMGIRGVDLTASAMHTSPPCSDLEFVNPTKSLSFLLPFTDTITAQCTLHTPLPMPNLKRSAKWARFSDRRGVFVSHKIEISHAFPCCACLQPSFRDG